MRRKSRITEKNNMTNADRKAKECRASDDALVAPPEQIPTKIA